MCSPAACRTCGKTGWTGCGSHVAQVMAQVPTDRRCTCQAGSPPQESRTRRWGLRSR